MNGQKMDAGQNKTKIAVIKAFSLSVHELKRTQEKQVA